MIDFTLFLNQISFAQVLLCGLLLLPYWRQKTSIALFALLMFCGAGYLVDDVYPSSNSAVTILAFLAGNALPGVFWLAALSVFGEQTQLKLKHYLFASLTLVVPTMVRVIEFIFGVKVADDETLYGVTKYGMLLFELLSDNIRCSRSTAMLTQSSSWRSSRR